uniref:Uncharacterized protein n=1 Tax=Panagrolaimus sp. JU765 TaxID=591449 RepID=A0AC34QJ71_9BILA
MGCRMSRTISQPDLASPTTTTTTNGTGRKMKENVGGMLGIPLISNGKESPRALQGRITNGNSILNRRDTPGSLLDVYSNRNGIKQAEDERDLIVCGAKPIGQVESASQADFFRMLDEKIAQGAKNLPESDIEE